MHEKVFPAIVKSVCHLAEPSVLRCSLCVPCSLRVARRVLCVLSVFFPCSSCRVPRTSCRSLVSARSLFGALLFSGETTTAANGRVASCRCLHKENSKKSKRKIGRETSRRNEKASVKYACGNANAAPQLTLKTEESPSQSSPPCECVAAADAVSDACKCKLKVKMLREIRAKRERATCCKKKKENKF